MYRIYPKVYRGKDGFSLRGPNAKIFFEKREQAEYVKEKLKENPAYEVTLEDFRR